MKEGDDHSLYGIFLAHGKQIKSHNQIEDLNIEDIAPTILNLMNYCTPKHMDGKSFIEHISTEKLKDFQANKVLIKNKKIKTKLEKIKIEEKLKTLKHIRTIDWF